MQEGNFLIHHVSQVKYYSINYFYDLWVNVSLKSICSLCKYYSKTRYVIIPRSRCFCNE